MGRSMLEGLAKAYRPKCLNCGEKDAKPLEASAMIFCTWKCASAYGLRMARERLLQWCPVHQEWHNEQAQADCLEEQELRLKDPRIPLG